jgi:hypothetical protein
MVQNLLKKHKKKFTKVRNLDLVDYRYQMLEKVTNHFHDFDRISKTYPLQSLTIKNVLRMVAGTKNGVFR